MYVYHGSVENGSLKKMCCLSPKQQAFYFHRFEKNIHGSLGQALSTEPRSNKSKARWRFPKKKHKPLVQIQNFSCVYLQFLEKPHAFFGGNTYIASQNYCEGQPIQLTMRIPDTCCCSDVPRHTCSRWKWERLAASSCLTWHVWECHQHHENLLKKRNKTRNRKSSIRHRNINPIILQNLMFFWNSHH